MAQRTSQLWQALIRTRGTSKEYAFDINGVWYGPEAEVSHSVDASLYEAFGVGNAMSATLTLSLYAPEIPRGAVVRRYVRLVNGKKSSEWLPKGEFFVNRRVSEDGLWTLEAYDAMLKADITWTPKLTFPCTMEAAARDIAAAMGVELDERNVYLPYVMDAYPEGYMRRDALRDIAAAHGGNWIISDGGKLRLIPLISFPAESSYLVTQHGDAILFGGTRILLSSQSGTAGIGAADGSKFYVGLDLTGCEDNGLRPPVTSVTLQLDRDNTVAAGSYTGLDLYALCPYATQEMATAILTQVQGYRYQAFRAESANIDPAVELGDGVDAGGLYSVIASIQDSGDGYPSLSAPGEEELEDEYPYRSATQRELDGDVDSLRAFITRSLGAMQIELNSLKSTLQALTLKVDDISNKVTELDSRVDKLEGVN